MDLVLLLIFAIGSVICHQLPERSFFIDGQQLPVCARCAGLYLGSAAGFAAWWAVKLRHRLRPIAVNPRRLIAWLAVAAAPTIVSYTSGVLGVWDGSNVTRAVLAVPLGLAAGAVVAAVSAKDLR